MKKRKSLNIDVYIGPLSKRVDGSFWIPYYTPSYSWNWPWIAHKRFRKMQDANFMQDTQFGLSFATFEELICFKQVFNNDDDFGEYRVNALCLQRPQDGTEVEARFLYDIFIAELDGNGFDVIKINPKLGHPYRTVREVL